jgi:hypothetical protein
LSDDGGFLFQEVEELNNGAKNYNRRVPNEKQGNV